MDRYTVYTGYISLNHIRQSCFHEVFKQAPKNSHALWDPSPEYVWGVSLGLSIVMLPTYIQGFA